MNFSKVGVSEEKLRLYSQFLSSCFPLAKIFNEEYLKWLYRDNPAGHVLGFDAWSGGELVAHYVCIPTTLNIEGEEISALLSLNTATAPSHQGKGLFTRLANKTYELAKGQGFSAVFGVSNRNSTYGMTEKLGFQLVQPLDVRIGFGPLKINFNKVKSLVQFQRVWSDESLHWRCRNPNNKVNIRQKGDKSVAFARASMGISVFMEIDNLIASDDLANSELSPIRLFLGLLPQGTCPFRRYFPIPDRLKPSPLNFIYRSLDGEVPRIEPGNAAFSFLDFDAY